MTGQFIIEKDHAHIYIVLIELQAKIDRKFEFDYTFAIDIDMFRHWSLPVNGHGIWAIVSCSNNSMHMTQIAQIILRAKGKGRVCFCHLPTCHHDGLAYVMYNFEELLHFFNFQAGKFKQKIKPLNLLHVYFKCSSIRKKSKGKSFA